MQVKNIIQENRPVILRDDKFIFDVIIGNSMFAKDSFIRHFAYPLEIVAGIWYKMETEITLKMN
ncbi:hypothetical protein ACFL35_10185 [Candidatus Riflebacteria bacterium]